MVQVAKAVSVADQVAPGALALATRAAAATVMAVAAMATAAALMVAQRSHRTSYRSLRYRRTCRMSDHIRRL